MYGFSVMHGQSPEYADHLSQILREMLKVAKLEVLRISPVFRCAHRPGVIGAAVVPMALMQNLE